jgi:hypothetical protein
LCEENDGENYKDMSGHRDSSREHLVRIRRD